jgi:hypothetical protein
MMAILKVTNIRCAVNKTSDENKFTLCNSTYKLKLFLSLIRAGVDALESGNKFVYACVKEICRLLAQPRLDTSHQLLLIVEAL